MQLIFWVCLFGAGYSYFLYPLILLLLPKRTPLGGAGDDLLPRVSLIITAHNEAARIGGKLANTLLLDYPPELLEIIVASDASTDETDQIVQASPCAQVQLVRAETRQGKEYAQLQAINIAQGEILVFSDVATEIRAQALRQLVQRFKDPKVGAVSSEDRFVTEQGEIEGEGAYVRYEMWLRSLESRVNSLVGLSGSFFAARASVCRQWDIQVPSDFNTALNCVSQALIAITDPQVIGYYKNIQSAQGEYARKFRTVVRGIAAVVRKRAVLNPLRYGVFSFQIWSHKILRWLVPWFLLGLLFSSFLLATHGWIYTGVLAMQCVFYGLVIAGAWSVALREIVAIRIPFYFMQVNLAIAHATLAFIFGKRITVWNPSKR